MVEKEKPRSERKKRVVRPRKKRNSPKKESEDVVYPKIKYPKGIYSIATISALVACATFTHASSVILRATYEQRSARAILTVEKEVEGNPLWPDSIKQWSELINKYSDQYQVPRDLVAAIMWKETWYNPLTWQRGILVCDAPNSMSCTSRSGARCAMQVMPRELGFTGRPTASELRDPDICIAWGVHILAANIQWGWNHMSDPQELDVYRFACAAYYAGITGASNGNGYHDYADLVIPKYLEYLSGKS